MPHLFSAAFPLLDPLQTTAASNLSCFSHQTRSAILCSLLALKYWTTLHQPHSEICTLSWQDRCTCTAPLFLPLRHQISASLHSPSSAPWCKPGADAITTSALYNSWTSTTRSAPLLHSTQGQTNNSLFALPSLQQFNFFPLRHVGAAAEAHMTDFAAWGGYSLRGNNIKPSAAWVTTMCLAVLDDKSRNSCWSGEHGILG
jgi:hypothetical protein